MTREAASAPSRAPNTGVIVGVIVAVLVAITITAGFGALWFMRKKRQQREVFSRSKPPKQGVVDLQANGQEAFQANQV